MDMHTPRAEEAVLVIAAEATEKHRAKYGLLNIDSLEYPENEATSK